MKMNIIKIVALMIVMSFSLNFNTLAQPKSAKSKTNLTKQSTNSELRTTNKTQPKHKFFLHYINIVTGNGLYA